jgi:hypothetical protein
MGTVCNADTFSGQLEALVVERFAHAAWEELLRRCVGQLDEPSESSRDTRPEYSASLREITALAATRLQGLCIRLMGWRASAQGQSKDLSDGKDSARLVDELLAEGLEAAMAAYSGANLDSEYADTIENIMIDLVKGAAAAPANSEPTAGGGSTASGAVAAAVLAYMSAHRLLVIVGKVQAAVKFVPASEKVYGVGLMQLLGKLQLGLGTSTHMLQSTQTLRIVSELSKDKALKCYAHEFKHAALDAAAQLLLKLNTSCIQREHDGREGNFKPWDELVSDLWAHALALRTKPKHALPALRLLAALVRAVPATSFDAKTSTLLQDHIFVALVPPKSGGVASKMLRAAGIGSAKTSSAEEMRVAALHALYAVMHVLQQLPPHVRVQSSPLISQVAPALKGVCETLGANSSRERDSRDVRDTAACLAAVAGMRPQHAAVCGRKLLLWPLRHCQSA